MMIKNQDNDGIWMFPEEHQSDFNAGIDRAVTNTG
jgi:hypothetical protein